MINNSSNPYYTSNGIPIPNNNTYFEPLVASKIDDADLLEKYQQNGFIFIKSFFPWIFLYLFSVIILLSLSDLFFV
jgi:hypothetical protein